MFFTILHTKKYMIFLDDQWLWMTWESYNNKYISLGYLTIVISKYKFLKVGDGE